jgi:hypothetical protein
MHDLLSSNSSSLLAERKRALHGGTKRRKSEKASCSSHSCSLRVGPVIRSRRCITPLQVAGKDTYKAAKVSAKDTGKAAKSVVKFLF